MRRRDILPAVSWRWRFSGAALVCSVAIGNVLIATADVATADLIPTPSDPAWVMSLGQAEVAGQSSDGFVDAYVKEWTQSKRWGLADHLDHYSSVSWARSHLQALRHSAHGSPAQSTVTDVEFADGAVKVVFPANAQGISTSNFAFSDGDYVAIIELDTGSGGPNPDTLMDQARLQLRTIPIPTDEINVTSRDAFSALVIVGVVAGALTVTAVAIAILVFVILRRRRSAVRVAIPPGAPVSPDGAYWWDGAAWRPRPPNS